MTAPNIDLIIRYEQGDTSFAENLALFADLIKSGMAWQLQGSYGRTAAGLIEAGLITPEGEITDDGHAEADKED